MDPRNDRFLAVAEAIITHCLPAWFPSLTVILSLGTVALSVVFRAFSIFGSSLDT